MSQSNQQEYNAIDVAKFICALLVVVIHVVPFGDNDSTLCYYGNYILQNWFARIAVPFFFVCSGFFLYRKTVDGDFSPTPTKSYVIKLIRLYVIWSALYFPMHIKEILNNENGVGHGVLVYCRDFIFKGSHYQLWYFPALIVAVILISFLLQRRMSLKTILIIAGIFYGIGLFAQTWFGVIRPLQELAPSFWGCLKLVQKVIFTTRDGLFEGFLFVGIGAYIAYHGFHLSKKKALTGFIISYILMFLEMAFVKHFNLARATDMYIFLVPLTYFAFVFVLNLRIPKQSDIFKKLRVYSGLIFFIHLWVLWVGWFIKRLVIRVAGVDLGRTCFLFVFTVIGSIVCAYFIHKLSEVERFRWVKKLYS